MSSQVCAVAAHNGAYVSRRTNEGGRMRKTKSKDEKEQQERKVSDKEREKEKDEESCLIKSLTHSYCSGYSSRAERHVANVRQLENNYIPSNQD